jgi:hypothetical protein
LLPWVHNERRVYRERGEFTTAESYLACGPCMATRDVASRQLWNCGRAPRIDGRRGGYPMPDGADRPSCDTCPGYLISLPQVSETLRAFRWWDKGQLRDYCDGETPPAPLRFYIDVLDSTRSEAEPELLRRLREVASA